MKRIILAAALSLTAGFAQAFDLSAMTDAERDAFRAEVRAYLLDNPEVLMEAIGVLEERQAVAEAANDQNLARAFENELTNDGYSYVGGNPDGDITIVEFMDYRCGYCKRAFPEVEALVSHDGNIRVVVKEYPILGEQSVLAARFAIAVKQTSGDEAYKLVHDTLMNMRGAITETALEQLARTAGLSVQDVFSQMNSDAVTEVLRRNAELGARMQISGTPTFVVEDEMVRGYVPQSQLAAIIAEQRAD